MIHVLGDDKEETMNEKEVLVENYEIVSQPERKLTGLVSNAKKLRLRKNQMKNQKLYVF